MNAQQIIDAIDLTDAVGELVETKNFTGIVETVTPLSTEQVTALLERLPIEQRAIVYRLLPKDNAIEVFERFSPALQRDLIQGLRDGEVATIFSDLDPDDRVWLLDELPAALAPRLLHGLSTKDRQLTSEVLGYPKGSVGRRMTPEYVSTRVDATVGETLQRVHAQLDDAETVYTLPVLDGSRHLTGVLSLRDLLRSDPEVGISEIMQDVSAMTAYETAEAAARRCAELGFLALPIVDREDRLVGMLTIDDAARILEHEETEDAARQGGVEPLRRPYLATPVRSLVSSRIIWLLVLAVGATLTVQVLSVFEATLEQVTVLALFMPLMIGTGGNTGNQAATTVTRALALGDVRPRDVWKVLLRELGVGMSLGALLGLLGGVVTTVIYDPSVGLIIGLTLLAVCTMAATIGGIMPMVARALRADPAVFSNPFISTFVDAAGLIVYFMIAQAVLHL
ncbi:magnesium transporter [Corynebacterium glyciniphilum]|uniref:magnesium transporter n=1 Tax=Corynebacterium glyciniphilum TaxID=1404244 RepID=UPI002654D533|nr:magnesium transporter [Corynebacterium glyciniphilum]MDN5682360.1 magnesium transporter [Corynebacterium glyciniphilum]MDN6705140.1 magnesium transporter [Corynebacterium glyciniphilum]